VVLAKRLIAKAQEVTKGKVFLLASYGNMDGVLADEWQVELKADDRMLPFASSEISLKHGARYDYADVVDRIDRIYGDLLVTVTNGTQERVKELPGAINNLLVSFATRATFDPEMMALDLEYTAKLGKYFDGVFRNTASVGNHGEHFVVRATDYAPAVGGKVPVPKTLGESVGVFFNTCAKMLRHECDIIHNNCADCADYQKFLANRFDELESSMKEFFEMADHYVAKARDLRYQIQHDDIIIGHGDDEDDVGLSAELIKSHQTAAVNALRQLQGRQAGASKVFHAEYSHVLAIREAVYQVLRKVLRKYYKAVMMVFADSTALAKSGLVGAREAVRALDRT